MWTSNHNAVKKVQKRLPEMENTLHAMKTTGRSNWEKRLGSETNQQDAKEKTPPPKKTRPCFSTMKYPDFHAPNIPEKSRK
jgi:hypothetical protein